MKYNLEWIRQEVRGTVEYFSEIDSTSLYLKRKILAGGAVPYMVIADRQTNGQGRVGKSFYSPASTGLYVTFCIDFDSGFFASATPRVACAVKASVDEVFGTDCQIKWVNDIYRNGKKVAGILCQKQEHYLLIGVGINVEKPKIIPDELKDRLGWLTDCCNFDGYNKLILALHRNIPYYLSQNENEIRAQFQASLFHVNQKVSITKDHAVITGICLGINDDFSLLLNVDGKVESFSSGILETHI